MEADFGAEDDFGDLDNLLGESSSLFQNASGPNGDTGFLGSEFDQDNLLPRSHKVKVKPKRVALICRSSAVKLDYFERRLGAMFGTRHFSGYSRLYGRIGVDNTACVLLAQSHWNHILCLILDIRKYVTHMVRSSFRERML